MEHLHTAGQRLENGGKTALLEEWRRLDYLLGKPLEYDSGKEMLPTVGAGLAEDGRYIVADASGREHRVTAGDVSPIRATS
ncbi:hypothetical protein GCAAIG_09775 [Candidatus Electronema halotolerans]